MGHLTPDDARDRRTWILTNPNIRRSDGFEGFCLAGDEIADQFYAQRHGAAKGVQCIEGETGKRNPWRERDKRAGLQFQLRCFSCGSDITAAVSYP